MAELIDSPPIGNLALREAGTSLLPAGAGEVAAASAAGGFDTAFPTLDIMRAAPEIGVGRDPVSGRPLERGDEIDAQGNLITVPPLPADEANRKYGIPGKLNFTAPVPESVARDMHARAMARIEREDVIARREGFGTGGLARLGYGLAGGLPGLVDPINLAAMFVPGVPAARLAYALGRPAESTLVRLSVGASQGAAGMAALIPLQYGLARHEQEDFTAADALFQIAMGGVLGGGLHTGIGFLQDRALARALDRASPETREAALRGSVAALADGRPVELAPLEPRLASDLAETAAREHQAEQARLAALTPAERRATPFETVPGEPQRLAEFLRQSGGLADEGGELAHILGGARRPGFLNQRGASLDDAALKAWEAGYLPGSARPSINDLLDALANDLHDRPVYSERDLPMAQAWREAVSRNDEIDRLATEHGIPTRGLNAEQFRAALAEKLGAPGVAATAERLAGEHHAIMRQAETEGWLPDFGEGAPRTTEELTNAYRQERADRLAAEGRYGIERPAPDAGAAGVVEAGARPGRPGAGVGRDPIAEHTRAQLAEPDQAPLRAAADDEARPALDRLNVENAEREAELRKFLAVSTGRAKEVFQAELDAVLAQQGAAAADGEALARAIEQGALCLGRRV